MLSKDLVSRILNSAGPYADDTQRQTCEKMIEDLTDEEQELAARTSYTYWFASQVMSRPSDERVRTQMAMREARRHLVGERNDYKKGLAALRKSCMYRKERKPDLLRTLFHTSFEYSDEEDAKMAAKYRSYLEEDLGNQLMVVRGMDQKSQAVVLKFPRQSSGTTDEAFVTAQMYITERAIATTEILSEGKAEKVVAVFDFGTYSRANAPPWSAVKTVTQLLQHHYPERLDHLVILDAPLFMRALFQLVHPFLSPETNEKVYMITGEEAKREKLGSLIRPEHSMPFMIPSGELTSEVDLDHFLKTVPFHALYDDSQFNTLK